MERVPRGWLGRSRYDRELAAAAARLRADLAEIVRRGVDAAAAEQLASIPRTTPPTTMRTDARTVSAAAEPLLSTAEVARRVGVHPRDVPRWFRKRGVSPHVTVDRSSNGQHLFRWRDVAMAVEGVSSDPWVRRELVSRPAFAELTDLELDGERCRRALAMLDARRAYALVAMLVNENTLEELGRELGVTRERARQIANRAAREFVTAFKAASRPRPPPCVEPPPPPPSEVPRSKPRRPRTSRELIRLDPFLAGVPLDQILTQPPAPRRRASIFVWDPWPWAPDSRALVMHRANVNAARGLHEIGDRDVVCAIAHGVAAGAVWPAPATSTAFERVNRVNAAFGAGPAIPAQVGTGSASHGLGGTET